MMQKNSKPYRVAHSRFLKGEPVCKKDKYDRVVTSVWSFDDSVLTYAATVFKQTNSRDLWNKSDHLYKALERYTKNPLRIKLATFVPKEYMAELSNISMDWYVAEHLIYKFGTHNKNPIDVRKVHGETTIYTDFNQEYSKLSSKMPYKAYSEDCYNNKYRDVEVSVFDLLCIFGGIVLPLTLATGYWFLIRNI